MPVSIPALLRASYRQGRLIPFVGAGISKSIDWVRDGEHVQGLSWVELVDRATKELGFSDPELARVRGTDLQILEYFKIKNDGEIAKLTNWLSRHMTPPDSAIRESPILAALVGLNRCRLIYTTNYDDFIERAYKLSNKDVRSVVVSKEMGWLNDGVEIVKFHGDLDHPEQIVLTEAHYEQRLTLQNPLDSRLRSDLLGRVALFIGYSFRDPNVSYLFRRVVAEGGRPYGISDGPQAYIALPDPSDFEYEMFRARQVEVIPIGSYDMTGDVADLLRQVGV